jgi:hypothetical protein
VAEVASLIINEVVEVVEDTMWHRESNNYYGPQPQSFHQQRLSSFPSQNHQPQSNGQQQRPHQQWNGRRSREESEEPRKRIRMESNNAAVEKSEECVLFSKDDTFVIDSGCSSHMTGNLELFESYEMLSEPGLVELADGSKLIIQAKGTLGPFKEVLFISGLSQNLVSVSQLQRDGFDVLFEEGGVVMKDRKTGSIIPLGILKGKLYHLDPKFTQEFCGSIKERRVDLDLWHRRLAHINERDLISMVNSNVVDGLNVSSRTGKK